MSTSKSIDLNTILYIFPSTYDFNEQITVTDFYQKPQKSYLRLYCDVNIQRRGEREEVCWNFRFEHFNTILSYSICFWRFKQSLDTQSIEAKVSLI